MRRQRSQALVATEPPAPELPLAPAKASILRPRGKREPPRKVPRRDARNKAGQAAVSDTRKEEGADKAGDVAPVPVLRVDDDEEVGLDAEAQEAAQGGVDADDESAPRIP